MSPDDLRHWQTAVGYRTAAEAATALGMGRSMYFRYLGGQSDIPLTVALACSALAGGLGPYRAAKARTKSSRPHPVQKAVPCKRP